MQKKLKTKIVTTASETVFESNLDALLNMVGPDMVYSITYRPVWNGMSMEHTALVVYWE